MESISAFITTLVTTLILITAVELIAPDNSIKKYMNFVLGLILISVMLAPIISFFSIGENKIIDGISRYEKDFTEMAKDEGREKIDTNRDESFKKNLDNNCNKLLEEEFKGREFRSNISCNMNLETMTYSIDKVEVGVKDDNVRTIQKIEINTSDSSEVIASQNEEDAIDNEEEIKIYLEQVFNIKAEEIKIYRLEE